MQIKATNKYGFPSQPFEGSIKEYVELSVEPDGYSYSGELEALHAKLNNLAELIGGLVEVLYENNKICLADLEKIVGGACTLEAKDG